MLFLPGTPWASESVVGLSGDDTSWRCRMLHSRLMNILKYPNIKVPCGFLPLFWHVGATLLIMTRFQLMAS